MATAKTKPKKTTKKEDPVITSEEVVTTQEEVVKTPDYKDLSPFGRLQAGYGVK